MEARKEWGEKVDGSEEREVREGETEKVQGVGWVTRAVTSAIFSAHPERSPPNMVRNECK